MKRLMIAAAVAVFGMAATGGEAAADGHGSMPGCHHHCHHCPVYQPIPAYPQYPVYVEAGNVTGFNPAGGIDTSGVTVFNTVNDPYRDMSRFNGSMRQVNRPVYDQFGNVVGYKSGVAWTNSVTGQTHFEGQTISNNGLGGVNVQHEYRSGRGR